MDLCKEDIPVYLTKEDFMEFKEKGYLVINNFLTDEEVQSLVSACGRLVDEMDAEQMDKTVFKANDSKRGLYFINSGDKVRFFYEEEALDKDSNLKVDKHLALNKIGHSLHWHVPEFKALTFSDKVKNIAKFLQFKDPAVAHSMYIFKQPHIGAEVSYHKDSTFLSTTPESCIGLWFALEDATEENGCLSFWPGSHKTPPNRRYIRNPDKDGPLLIFTNPKEEDQPDMYKLAPVKKGGLILIHGQVYHKSAKNTSSKSRNIYTFHIIERSNTVWSPQNWLQPTEQLPFTGLYEN